MNHNLINPRLCNHSRHSATPWRSGLIVGLAATALGAGSAIGANILVDPSFENNALGSYSTVLNNFVPFQGVWGAENSTITGAVGGVTPPDGFKMLSMFDDSLLITQAVQVIDVRNMGVGGGTGTFALSASFNAENVPGAQASIFLQFFTGPRLNLEIPGSQLGSTVTLDSLASSWETIPLSGSIPAGTRWMVAQVGYWNASMGGQPGYVDKADLSLVPAPGSLALLTLGGALGARRRRRA